MIYALDLLISETQPVIFCFSFFYNMLKFVFGCEGFLDGCECGIFCLWKLLLMGEIAASLDF